MAKRPLCFRTAAASVFLESLGIVLCMLLLIPGCGKTAPKTGTGGEPTVEMIDTGAEPKTLLRYKPQAGTTQEMVMEMDMAMTMAMGGMKPPETKSPTMKTTVTIYNKDVSPEGDLYYEFEVGEVDALPRPGVSSATVDAMKQQLGGMKGMSGHATVTARGVTKEAQIYIPPEAGAQIQQQTGNMRQSLDQMSAPLPAEPVGKGARWKVTMPIDTPQMKMTQTADYVLSEIQGDKVKFDVTINQSAPRQEIEAPGAPQGTKMILESMKSSGKGTIQQDMTGFVSTLDMEMTSTTVISANNQKMEKTMRMAVKMKMRP